MTRLIYLVADELGLAQDLVLQISQFGYTVRTFTRPEALREAVYRTPPAAIVIHSMQPGFDLVDSALIGEIKRAYATPIPVMFISARGDLVARLQAVRAGGDAYFTRPLDVSRFVDQLDMLAARHVPEPYRILIADDDVAMAQYYALTLQQVNMVTETVTDPMRIMHALIEFKPDLILMDLYMPGCTGLELAAVIRQQEAFVSIPIVFLSAETNPDKQLAALRLGGDDFLTKPIQHDHLISSVLARVQRSRILHAFMVRDSLTGLLNHTRIKEQLTLEVERAKRQRSQLSFAMIDIDDFKSVNDTYGHPTGDRVIKSLAQVLQQRLRKTDIIGRYGGEEFAVILPDTNGPTARFVLNEIHLGFSQIQQQAEGVEFFTTFSAGIATFPHYADAAGLSSAADKALYEAKHVGRNRIMLAPEAPVLIPSTYCAS